jgi:membrane-bound lytic murein transglycosylase D
VLKEENVPEDMIYLAALLSDMLPNAQSRSGGVGWWMLGSFKEKKTSPVIQWVFTNEWDDRRDPVLSTRIAGTMFQSLNRRSQTNDWLLTVCAFIEGADTVDAVAKKAPDYSYWDVVMPQRCETLIPRLVALKILENHRELYGVNVSPPPPLAYDSFDRLKLAKDLPLYVVAEWCRTNPRSIWELNPGVDPAAGLIPKPDKRSPSGFPLRVPKGMGAKVRKMLVQYGYLEG